MKETKRMIPLFAEALDQVFQGADDGVEQLVHQLGFHHFRDVGDDLPAGAGHPAGFRVGAAAAGEYEDAGVRPFQGCQVGGELAFRLRVVKSFGILREGPGRGVFVDVRPAEAFPPWGGFRKS